MLCYSIIAGGCKLILHPSRNPIHPSHWPRQPKRCRKRARGMDPALPPPPSVSTTPGYLPPEWYAADAILLLRILVVTRTRQDGPHLIWSQLTAFHTADSGAVITTTAYLVSVLWVLRHRHYPGMNTPDSLSTVLYSPELLYTAGSTLLQTAHPMHLNDFHRIHSRRTHTLQGPS